MTFSRLDYALHCIGVCARVFAHSFDFFSIFHCTAQPLPAHQHSVVVCTFLPAPHNVSQATELY